ncbi:hypothetical protein G5714_004016 [Onychostoma macrolepis]|uniref:Uncharacterized protein n=1 Tax=Onychostoma macrolepis TaxID=369639 RepID=A0A7J6DB32_9TELE|nr:hypothetical protein G5714_004016 [Onychostoma macrolepis]
MVPVTCPQLETAELLLEPLGFEDGQLPEGLLVSPTLVFAKKGLLYAPVVNVGCTEVWLSPRRVIGTVQAVVATSAGTKLVAFEPSWEEGCAYVSTQEAITSSSVPESVLPDFEGLTPQQILQAKALFAQSDELIRRRNQRHNDNVNDPGLEEGRLVYLRNHVPGRNKIQDHWNSVVFQVLRSPSGTGTVYTVAPRDGEGPVRQVHRSELRAVPEGLQSVAEETTPSMTRADLSANPMIREEEGQEDVVIFHPEETQEALCSLSSLAPAEVEAIPEDMTLTLRRSVRSTAGQHPNPYRLPRAVSAGIEEGMLPEGGDQGIGV